MSSDYTPTNIQQGFQMEVAINQNFNDIQTAMNKLLNRLNIADNAMSIDFDIGGNNLINLPAATDPTHPVRLGEINTLSIPEVVADQTIIASTVNIDPLSVTVADILLTENINILITATATVQDARPLLLRLRQDATGSRTVTWPSNVRFSTDAPEPLLTTTANKTDYILVRYHSDDDKYDVLAINRGF